MWKLTDESLLAGLATGQSEAVAAFVRRFQGRVFGLCLAIVRDPYTAEEVAQETFVRAWQHAGSYDARRGRVSTWLLTIARNIAVDTMRVRRPEPFDPDSLSLLIDAGAGGEEHEYEPDEIQWLRRAVASLPFEQRRALVLAAFFGRTAQEICELEGVPLGTVKTRLRSAMMKVRASVRVRDER